MGFGTSLVDFVSVEERKRKRDNREKNLKQ
jgi:hypothetical protein